METKDAVIPLQGSPALEEFLQRTETLPYRAKGIFPSEMFLFYLWARDISPDVILESGVGNGCSTRYLAALFPDIPIEAVDADLRLDLRQQMPANVILRRGDSRFIFPQMLKRHAGVVAVLIDGPKQVRAVHLAWKLMHNPRVKLIAIHDLQPKLSAWGKFHSHDAAFRRDFSFLDEKVGSWLDAYPQGPGLSIFHA